MTESEDRLTQIAQGTLIEIGDIRVFSSVEGVDKLKQVTKDIIKDKKISNYLNINLPRRKFAGLGLD